MLVPLGRIPCELVGVLLTLQRGEPLLSGVTLHGPGAEEDERLALLH